MKEYKRAVSYIYLYKDGVKDRNTGFAKAEVRNGIFTLNISLTGLYTDIPEKYLVCLIIKENGYKFLEIGKIIVNGGIGKYRDVFNPDNINDSGFEFSDIEGIGIAKRNETSTGMYSMWNDEDLRPGECQFINQIQEEKTEKSEEVTEEIEKTEKSEEVTEEIEETEKSEDTVKEKKEETGRVEKLETVKVNIADECNKCNDSIIGKLFSNADYINAFDDDNYYDCIEITPDMLRILPVDEEMIKDNSFLAHGFYNYKHLLFGRVRENDKHTQYFLGVPGMYCNRERYMASMFGFSNFKKSHRSDYPNPYFGYWYQEI